MIKELYSLLEKMGLSQKDISSFIDEFIAGESAFSKDYTQSRIEADERKAEKMDSLSESLDGCDQESCFIHHIQIKSAFEHLQRKRIKLLSIILDEAIPKIGSFYTENGESPSLCFDDNYRLIVFDVDGTLIDSTKNELFLHVWGVLDRAFGTEKENWEFEKEYRQGKITYSQWVDKILSLYVERGADKEKLYQATEHIKPVEGAMETLGELKDRGKKLAVISGGLSFILDKYFPRDLFSQVEINEIYFDEKGKISGWKATPYGDGKQKAMGLIDICNRTSNHLNDTVFVGDAGNDVYAIRLAGLGIAFYPKQMLEWDSDIIVGSRYIPKQGEKDLRGILKYIT